MATPIDQRATLIEIRREAWHYASRKPGKVPPADSPSRPHLAKLWHLAFRATQRRRRLRTFKHAGWRFGIAFVQNQLCVFDWETQELLVRHPGSMESLAEVLRSCDVEPR